MALALDLVHHDPARDVEPSRRRAGLRQLARERHRDAAAVGGREQLLGARLPFRLPDARRQREAELGERAACRRVIAPVAAGDVPLPDDLRRCVRSAAFSLHVGTAAVCRRGSRPRPASLPAGRRRAPASRRARVLERVDELAPADGRTSPAAIGVDVAADVQRALALQDVDHLVVAVEVVGRAPGRDVADELRRRRAAELGVAGDELRPAVASPASTSSTSDHRVADAVRGKRIVDEDRQQLECVRAVDTPARSRRRRTPLCRDASSSARRQWSALPAPAST